MTTVRAPGGGADRAYGGRTGDGDDGDSIGGSTGDGDSDGDGERGGGA
ncbi:hypothetical protein [Streptomyces sp. NPDC056169]